MFTGFDRFTDTNIDKKQMAAINMIKIGAMKLTNCSSA